MEIEAAVRAFFVEFSKFDLDGARLALRALSKDDAFVTQAESILGLEARLTLIERLAFARRIPVRLMAELEQLLMRTRTLRDQRDELARALAQPGRMSMLPLSQIESLVTEAIELQGGFRALAESVDRA